MEKGQKQHTVWERFRQDIKEDLRLRRVLMPVRRADSNSGTLLQDKLKVSNKVFLSMFLLFNSSLLALYVVGKDKQAMRAKKVPMVFGCLSLLAYKLELEWLSRQIIRKCQESSSDVAYNVRKRLLEECGEHPFVKSRAKMLQAKNSKYQLIYKP